MLDGAHLIADDVAVIIVARNIEDTKRKANKVVIRTKSWLEYKGLKLATEIMDLILLVRKCIPLETNITPL